MTTSTDSRRHLDVADKTRHSGLSFTAAPIHPATASVRSTMPVPAREPARPGAIGRVRPAAIVAFHALAATARRLGASWQAGAAKDALIEEHRDKVRSQIHLFGGRY
ncbi:MAG: hypothetical protein ACQEXN_18145 [Actinomycetota bacterium]